MSDPITISGNEEKLLHEIVAAYVVEIDIANTAIDTLKSLFSVDKLSDLIHSMKARTKDPKHLYDKLLKRLKKSKEDNLDFDISPDNVFEKINDLVGIRLLHLHTSQFEEINEAICSLLGNQGYEIINGPEAKVWDDEYTKYFKSIGVTTTINERMYTSVHYEIKTHDVGKNGKGKIRTAEIQVRTLAEELWGEVDHAINYPIKK